MSVHYTLTHIDVLKEKNNNNTKIRYKNFEYQITKPIHDKNILII